MVLRMEVRACAHKASTQPLSYPTTELHPLLVLLFLYLPDPQSLFSLNSKPTKHYSPGRDPGTLGLWSGSKVCWRNVDRISPHLFLQCSCDWGPVRQGFV